jgi:hypothetical protein
MRDFWRYSNVIMLVKWKSLWWAGTWHVRGWRKWHCEFLGDKFLRNPSLNTLGNNIVIRLCICFQFFEASVVYIEGFWILTSFLVLGWHRSFGETIIHFYVSESDKSCQNWCLCYSDRLRIVSLSWYKLSLGAHDPCLGWNTLNNVGVL